MVYLDCAVESAAERGSKGEAGERGDWIDGIDPDPDRACAVVEIFESGGIRDTAKDMMKGDMATSYT
jgi:hypothetical protein